MSRLDNNPDLAVGMSAVTARMNTGETQHWKYPETVGNDTIYDDINFNSDETSEYAVARMSHISTATHEPFMLFEFMKVDNDDYGTGTANAITGFGSDVATTFKNAIGKGETDIVGNHNNANSIAVDEDTSLMDKAEDTFEKIKSWAKSIGNLVKRKYTGSIALYMPNDIQINDQMVYNEDSRKMGALAETLFSGNYEDAFNPST